MLEVHRLVGPAPGAPAGVEDLYAGAAPGVEVSRRSLRLAPGAQAHLDTYAAGLPVGNWRVHTPVRALELRSEVHGSGRLRVRARTVGQAVRTVVEQPLSAGPLALTTAVGDDDLWWWLEAEAGDAGLQLRGTGWWAAVATPCAGVAITTHDRPADCVAALTALAADLGVVQRVVVVDQGSRRVREHPGFPAAAAALGPALRLVEQPNLGGSGGYARGAVELLEDPALTHVVLLDDDVAVEPEAVRRLVCFGAAAGEVLVGGQMLELPRPTVLHSTGEVVDRRRFWWGPAPGAVSALDLAGRPLSEHPAVTRVTPVDFNGWWMCALPTSVLRRLGLPLPLFLKWDDVEYGLRAAAAGVPTVTLPGAAVWHEPWTGKDASRDWQAYFLTRNRLVVAALHGDGLPWGLLAHLAAHAVSHLVTMAYSAADLVVHGIEDFARGPGALVPTMVGGPAALGPRRARFVDSAAAPPPAPAAPPPAPASPAPAAPADVAMPRGRAGLAVRLVGGVARALAGPPAAVEPPSTALALADARWPVLARLDNAWVGDAAGTGSGSVRRRDPRVARAVAVRLLRAVAVTALRWPSLRRQYRSAAPRLVTPQAWEPVFRSGLDSSRDQGRPGGADRRALPEASPLLGGSRVEAE